MKLVSTLALAAASATAVLTAQPAVAAPKDKPAQPAAARKYQFSKEAQKPLQELQTAVTKKDEAAYPARLAAAQAVATTTDDKYILAKLMVQHAEQVNDQAARLAGYQAIAASGGADAAELSALNHKTAILAATAGNWALAETALTASLATTPDDLDSVVNLARAKLELKKRGEALVLLQRAIALSKAKGQTPPETWYRNALGLAYEAHNTAVVDEMNRELIRSYPSGGNFKNAIAIYRSSGKASETVELDLLRLMLASGNMSGNEYVYLASVADQAGLPGEVKRALEAGRRAGAVTGTRGAQLLAANENRIAADRASLAADEAKALGGGTAALALNTGNAYFGYGEYTKAANLFRAALRKGPADPSLANLRLGEALALGGQRAESETAFKAVTGPRGELAALWLTWLGMPH